MTTTTSPRQTDDLMSLPARTEAWLDARGKGAWIVAMVLGFILFWPVGLAILAYMIWSKRMFSGCSSRRRADRDMTATSPSGNVAFDAYRADTLRRLEEERVAFEGFLERLRAARDRAEFEQFMSDRTRRTDDDRDSAEGPRMA
jgi:hypothetical protein